MRWIACPDQMSRSSNLMELWRRLQDRGVSSAAPAPRRYEAESFPEFKRAGMFKVVHPGERNVACLTNTPWRLDHTDTTVHNMFRNPSSERGTALSSTTSLSTTTTARLLRASEKVIFHEDDSSALSDLLVVRSGSGVGGRLLWRAFSGQLGWGAGPQVACLGTNRGRETAPGGRRKTARKRTANDCSLDSGKEVFDAWTLDQR